MKEITDLVERWDRTIGAPRPAVNSGADGDDLHHSHPQSGKKGKKALADKHKHEEKEAAKAEKEKEVSVCVFYTLSLRPLFSYDT